MRKLVIRPAGRADVPAVVALITDDAIAAARESAPGGGDDAYLAAFDRIDADPDDVLLVGEVDGRVVACAQVTLLHHLSRQGGTRAQVESVRVARDQRGTGLGSRLMQAVEDHARAHGATMLQLTTDRRRTDAHRFYERLGFEASHLGMKRRLQ
jgi:GNAT superfamily N-acetyltransferase